jgi:NAD(P)-dependent dehydrogenase (short-subunit alcohol dehydrogenase family)
VIASTAARRFTLEDQQAFAEVSGDFNPMHMDPVAARRTSAGDCVVHGVQAMLWALEELADSLELERLRSLDADFGQFLYLGELVELNVVRSNPDEARFELRVDGARVSQYVLKFGSRAPGEDSPPQAGTQIEYAAEAKSPLPLSWEEISGASGCVHYFSSVDAVRHRYPRLAAKIGVERVAGILAFTRLVGMACPGLHSVFHRINVQLVDAVSEGSDRLYFSVSRSDPRFALITMDVHAGGIRGSLRASRRSPPTVQDSAAGLRAMIARDSFLGSRALVVGGSRGLGEITAKLLAMGGAEVTITFARGATDAEAVIDDIRSAGGRADAMRLDVLQPIAGQLGQLSESPSSMYYFATPKIVLRPETRFSPDRFRRFAEVYVDGFYALCNELAVMRKSPLQAFYPSSVAIEQLPPNWAEYAMAKAAGEVLATDMTQSLSGVTVESVRLPRLPTDQTVSMIEQDVGSPAAAMLPIIERIERRVTQGAHA